MFQSSFKGLLSCFSIWDEDAHVEGVVGRQKMKADGEICRSCAGQGMLQCLPVPGSWGKGDSSCTESCPTHRDVCTPTQRHTQMCIHTHSSSDSFTSTPPVPVHTPPCILYSLLSLGRAVYSSEVPHKAGGDLLVKF